MQVVIYNNLGYTSVAIQLALNLANQVVSVRPRPEPVLRFDEPSCPDRGTSFLQAICALTAATLSDYMPRRKVLITGTFTAACLLAVNATLSLVWSRQPKDAAGNIINVSPSPFSKILWDLRAIRTKSQS